ncbi:sigma-70 family RNA polymerase sigma factor [Candidatus Peregrinibacteria bacterium]|jgi:RNA polymerase sigma factor (sigma-70 family)|nr:sigma-70 family RNA polymerase sigma factor [Candidatus Peregrinibacteria bacterium]
MTEKNSQISAPQENPPPYSLGMQMALRDRRLNRKSGAAPSLDPLDLFKKAMDAAPSIDREMEAELARRFHEHGDMAAKEALIIAHLRTVYWCAYDLWHPRLDLMDLIQEGMVGLLKAIDDFDLDLGFLLKTYAKHKIRADIRAFCMNNRYATSGRTSTQGARVVYHRLGKAVDALKEKFGRSPTDEEIRDELAKGTTATITVQHVKSIREAVRNVPLHAPLGKGKGKNDGMKIDVIDSGAASPEALVVKAYSNVLQRRAFEDAFRKLPAREQFIIKERHLIDDKRPTLEELGRRLGISRERVRQLEARGLRRLRDMTSEITHE